MTFTVDTNIFIMSVLNKKALKYVNEIIFNPKSKGIFIHPILGEAKHKLLDLNTQIIRILNDPTRKKIKHGTISLINNIPLYRHFREKIPGFVEDITEKFNKKAYEPFFKKRGIRDPKLNLHFVLLEKMKIILLLLKKIDECRNVYPSLKRDFMNQSIANKNLRYVLKQFGDSISNPIKMKLLYSNAYGNQIKKKVTFITTDNSILKEKELIESKLHFVNILNYDSTDEDDLLRPTTV